MKKRILKFKRGLSPVIATILLVMLVLILAALIFLWAQGLISEQIMKNGQLIENICPSINFDVNLVANSSGHFLEAVNRGSVSIYSLDIKRMKGGDSSNTEVNLPLDVGKSFIENIGANLEMKDGSIAEKITVYPRLVGNIKGGKLPKPYTCLDNGKTITI